jgi:hypothetical protein
MYRPVNGALVDWARQEEAEREHAGIFEPGEDYVFTDCFSIPAAGLGETEVPADAPAWSRTRCEEVFRNQVDSTYDALYLGISAGAGMFGALAFACLTRRPVGKWALGGAVVGATASAVWLRASRYDSARSLYGEHCPGM